MLYIIGEGRYSLETQLLTFLMILYRMWDAVSDLFQGLFQQRAAMDTATEKQCLFDILRVF